MLGIPVEFVFFDDLGINFTVIQVVRRFGEVGGMDSYVWQLSHALVNLGVPVIVLYEEALHPHSPEIYVIRVKKARKKPRGLSLFRFGLRARKIYSNLRLERLPEKFIVHSQDHRGDYYWAWGVGDRPPYCEIFF